MTNRNPSNKTFSLTQLRGRWADQQHKLEQEERLMRMHGFAGEFRGKNVTTLALKRGKKVYVKGEHGLVELSLAQGAK